MSKSKVGDIVEIGFNDPTEFDSIDENDLKTEISKICRVYGKLIAFDDKYARVIYFHDTKYKEENDGIVIPTGCINYIKVFNNFKYLIEEENENEN